MYYYRGQAWCGGFGYGLRYKDTCPTHERVCQEDRDMMTTAVSHDRMLCHFHYGESSARPHPSTKKLLKSNTQPYHLIIRSHGHQAWQPRLTWYAAVRSSCLIHSLTYNDGVSGYNCVMMVMMLTRGWGVDTAAWVPSTGDRRAWKFSLFLSFVSMLSPSPDT